MLEAVGIKGSLQAPGAVKKSEVPNASRQFCKRLTEENSSP